jgi:thiamine biosynthesis lipoprotein
VSDAPVAASFPALGTTATVAVLSPSALPAARYQLARWVDEVDRVCSRFRPDSEIVRAGTTGAAVPVSPLLARFLRFALDAARATAGNVDPTLGAQLRAAGYDRTFSLVQERDSWPVDAPAEREHSWQQVELDDDRLVLTVPAGVELDLGATAKALAADAAARAIAASTGSAVLVSLGGDIAVAGTAPAEGWAVLISDDHASSLGSDGPTVAIKSGGLATSSTTVRRWRTESGEAHHIIDPRTCRPAATPWHTVTVAAATCGYANVAATNAIILGEPALDWLGSRGLPARFVRRDGSVVTVGGWPSEARAA